MCKTRIYLSGPISGVSDYMIRFAEAEKELVGKGYRVINPAKIGASLPEDMTYEEIVEIDIHLLEYADAIYLLRGWQSSRGANREYGYALGAGKDIMKQETSINPLYIWENKDNHLNRIEQEGEQHE